MRGSIRPLLIALAVMMAVAVSASAADTGTVSGFVVDPERPAGRRRDGEDLGRPPAGRPHRADRCERNLSVRIPASRRVRHRDRQGRRSAARGAPRSSRSGRTRRSTSSSDSTLNEALAVTVARPVVDVRSTEVSFNFKSGHAQRSAARSHLSRSVPADPRRRRQPKHGRAGCRRQPPGQHLSDRRREHHQPRVRVSQHRGQRARHRRSQSQARGHHRRVRPHRRHGHQRGQPQPARISFSGIGRIDWLSKRSGRRLQAAGRPARRRRQAGHLPRSAADDGDRTGRRARRSDRAESRVLLWIGALLARNEVGSRQQGRRRAAGRSALGSRVLRQAHRDADDRAIS